MGREPRGYFPTAVGGALSPAARVLPHCGGEAFGRAASHTVLPHRSGIERPENSPVESFQQDGARPCAMGPNAPALGARVWQALECVSKCREMQFRVDLTAFQGDFPQVYWR